MPFDLIPDFLPIIDQLDEVVIILFLLFLTLKLTPQAIIKEYRDHIS
jgi:uncharacterized membrane protein YkvA (DUF1232 family)